MSANCLTRGSPAKVVMRPTLPGDEMFVRVTVARHAGDRLARLICDHPMIVVLNSKAATSG